ncbi:hypothetical protein BAY59_09700 [Prauserella coralliicola]|nr:hypothetical protein BAY59_09700 [Prauserella coralliicola]
MELVELAKQANVNRATVQRWFGSRANLLTEIVWSLAEPTLEHCYRAADGTGGSRIAEALSDFVRQTLTDTGMRAFLNRENETALRILTRRDHSFQPRLIAAVENLLEREHNAGTLEQDIPLHDLAYLCVRVGESFVYTDTITGEPADPDRAERAFHYLLARH